MGHDALVRARYRLRRAVNLANGSTLAGLGVAAIGGAGLARGPDGLFTGTGYRLPVPPAPAFCLGNVIVTRLDAVDPGSPLWHHEARHATQFAWCGGVVMVPLYLAAAGVSSSHACCEKVAILSSPFLTPPGNRAAGKWMARPTTSSIAKNSNGVSRLMNSSSTRRFSTTTTEPTGVCWTAQYRWEGTWCSTSMYKVRHN